MIFWKLNTFQIFHGFKGQNQDNIFKSLIIEGIFFFIIIPIIPQQGEMLFLVGK